MKRSYLGLLLVGISLYGCSDLTIPHADSADGYPPPILDQDSLAIVEMKMSMGVWNGIIRDWAYDVRYGCVRRLRISSSLGRRIVFPKFGLDSLAVADISINADTMTVEGLERLDSLKELFCYGISPRNLQKWPRGVYSNMGIKKMTVSGVFGAIDDSVMMIDSLQYLSVGGNVTEIPAAFLSRSNLMLDVSGNRICDPSPDVVVWLNKHSPDWKWQNCPN